MSIFAVSVTVTFIDDKGKTSSTKCHIPTGLSIAAITAFCTSFGQLLADFSSCQVTGVKACVGLDLSSATLRAVAAAGSDIANKAQALFTTGTGLFSRMIMPTASDSYTLTDSDAFDEADGDVAALVTIFEDGITTTGGTIAPVDLRDNDITGVTEFRETFRKFKPSA